MNKENLINIVKAGANRIGTSNAISIILGDRQGSQNLTKEKSISDY